MTPNVSKKPDDDAMTQSLRHEGVSSPHSRADDFKAVERALFWPNDEDDDDAALSSYADIVVEGQHALERIVEQFETCREHLRETVDTAIWMSGSDDFAPNGKAGDEWVRRREFLYKALTFLSLSEPSNPAKRPS